MNMDKIGLALRTLFRGAAVLLAIFGVDIDEAAVGSAVDAILAGVAAVLWLVPEVIAWIKAIRNRPVELKPAE